MRIGMGKAAAALAVMAGWPAVATAQPYTVAILGSATSPVHNEDVRDNIMCAGKGLGANVPGQPRVAYEIERIDLFDTSVSTPSALDLESYDALLVYNEIPFADPIALGDTVAAFVEGGGGLVIGGNVFATGTELTGRFASQGLSPFEAPGTSAQPGGNLSIAATSGADLWTIGPQRGSVLFYGYRYFDGGSGSYQVQGLQVVPQAQRLANWANFEPAVVVLEPGVPGQGRVAGLNLFPPSNRVDAASWAPESDGARLLNGALRWVLDFQITGDCENDDLDQDLNCNDKGTVEEGPIDNSPDECQDNTDPLTGLPYDNGDFYWSYFDWECAFPVSGYDADFDGFGFGTFDIVPPGGMNPWDTINLRCDNCPERFNPNQLDFGCDGSGDLCDLCPWDDDGVDPAQTFDLDVDCWGDPCDNCPLTPNPAQYDDDNDQVGNACDNCPEVANPFEFDPTTSMLVQPDVDADGVGDACDNCLGAPMFSDVLPPVEDTPNADQLDTDGDGWGDACDNCPLDFNPEQTDSDDDDVGDLCDNCPGLVTPDVTDQDGDGLGDQCDSCPLTANADQRDIDVDGIGDACDNCPIFGNPDQNDLDEDGRGDACDNCQVDFNPDQADADVDEIGDECDNCPFRRNFDQEDGDGDGFGDGCDFCLRQPTDSNEDFDGDGIGDDCDNCPIQLNADQLDDDEDEVGNACDTLSLRGGGELRPPSQGCGHAPAAPALLWAWLCLVPLAGRRRR